MCAQQTAEVRNQVSGMVHMARDGARAKTPLFWEVYVGEGRLSTEVSRLGAHVERFGLHEGWDFSLSTHRSSFLQKIDTDAPDEIFISKMHVVVPHAEHQHQMCCRCRRSGRTT